MADNRKYYYLKLKESYFEQMKNNVEVALNSEKMICNVGAESIVDHAS